MALCLTAVFAYSQVWTAQDSLHLKKLLESDQELHLNMDAVKSIDFGSAVGTPRMSEEKSWMMPDESLPEALPKPKVMLTLMPYKANTRYNWDPIYQKKIKIDKIPGGVILSTRYAIKDLIQTGHAIRWQKECVSRWMRYRRVGCVSVSWVNVLTE